MEHDQAFLEFVIKSLVDNPEEVKISRQVDELGVLLTLAVNKDDMGKVIGRSGATAKAIRTILRVVGMKHDARVNLKIEEPEGGMRASAGADAGVDDGDRGTVADIPAREPKAPVQMRELDDVLGDLK